MKASNVRDMCMLSYRHIDDECMSRCFVRQAIDTHNSAYGMDFSIQDRADEVYPTLRGCLNWDWVFNDQASVRWGRVRSGLWGEQWLGRLESAIRLVRASAQR